MSNSIKYIALGCVLIFAGIVAYLNIPCLSPKGLNAPDEVMKALLDSASQDSGKGLCEVVQDAASKDEIDQALQTIDVLARDAGGYDQLVYGEPDQGGRGYTYRLTSADNDAIGLINVYSVHRPWYKRLLQYPFFQTDAYYLTIPIVTQEEPVSN